MRANLEAIRAWTAQSAEGRPPTAAEQAVYARWSGWGATPELFDERPAFKERYAAERAELRELLGEKGYRAARATTLNAHYTDAAYVQAIWTAVGKLGFTGGRFLEPGCGSGNFIGFAPDGAQAVGVERDPTTAALAQALYPEAQILAESFADTRSPAGAFDLVVGNVPFGSHALQDEEHNPARRHSIHNHFILKSLRLTRPGGIVALITSHYTMDGKDDAHREARAQMGELADLVGAVRLPTAAHSAAAGTDVVSDLIVLRRRENDRPREAGSWQEVRSAEFPGAREGVEPATFEVNEHFLDHPEMVLGEALTETGRHGPKLAVRGNGPAAPALTEALDRIVANARERGLIMTAADTAPGDTEIVLHGPIDEQEGVFKDLGDGRFAQVRDGRPVPHFPPKTQAAELGALIGMRDTVLALLDEEASHREDTWRMNELRVELNRRYERYLAKYGPINRYKSHAGTRVDKATGETVATERRTYPRMGGFRDDPFFPYVSALEKFDDETQDTAKADIFDRRVVVQPAPLDRAQSPDDALVVSWDLHNEVRLDEIARLLGLQTEEQARKALGTLVYDEPGTGRLVRKAEYLSGNVRRKLTAAEQAAADNSRFAVNVEALRAVVPRDLTPGEIGARLGSPWIEASYVQQFLCEVLEDPRISVSNLGARWSVTGGDHFSVLSRTVWGTKDRCAQDLADSLLNSRTIEITRTHEAGGTKTTVKDGEATAFAQAKAQQLDERFRAWLWEDPERAEHLGRTYNDRFNSLVPQSFDGEHVAAPGMSAAFELRPHQMAAVARIRNTPGVGLFHGTGAGKTLEMIVGGMELVRLGLVSKPAYVVPKGVLGQFQREFLQAYPRARVLAVDSEDLTGDKRRQFVARCSTGNWDAVIISHTAFKKIPVSKSVQVEYLERQKERLEAHLANADDGDRYTVKDIEKQVEALEERIKEVLATSSDAGVDFERTGIGYLFIDEAHVYKNLMVISSIPELAHKGNQITADLDMKLGYLRRTYGRRVVTLATATPIDNSPSEILTMTKYAAPELLEALGIEEDDQFHATFIQPRRRLEMTPDGSRFESRTRHARFVNLPEAKRLMYSWADVKLKKDLDLKEPAIVGGEQEVLTVPASAELQMHLADLALRARAVTTGKPPLRTTTKGEQREDNILWISTDGRLASLDLRLTGLHTDEPQKMDVLADRIAELWREHRDDVYYGTDGTPEPARGSLQLVFCDLGVPGKDRWSFYEGLRDELSARGMPREAVRFAQEATNRRQKDQLQRDARNGKIAVLIGSRSGLGTGVNIQRRVIAVIQADPTWKLTPLTQSLGRGQRQGNVNSQIHHIFAVTEGSYDPFLWQKVDDKARFTDQMLDPTDSTRTLDVQGEDEGGRINPAIMFAVGAGRPELLALHQVEETVGALKLEQRIWHNEQFTYKATISQHRRTIATLQSEVAELDELLSRRRNTARRAFEMTVDGRRYDRRPEAGAALIERMAALADEVSGRPRQRIVLGELGNFPLVAEMMPPGGSSGKVGFGLDGVPHAAFEVTVDAIAELDPTGLVRKLENRLTALDEARQRHVETIERLEANIAQAEKRVGQPFPRQKELEEQTARFEELQKTLESVGNKSQTPDAPGRASTVSGETGAGSSSRAASTNIADESGPAVGVAATPAPADVIREVREPLKPFSAPLAELEAEALTDSELLGAARANPIREFQQISIKWIEKTISAKRIANDAWAPEFVAAYHPVSFEASVSFDASFRIDVNGYLTARVWEHGHRHVPAAERHTAADHDRPDVLAPYREVLGEAQCAVIDARAMEIAQQVAGRDDAEWRAERDRARVAFDDLDTDVKRDMWRMEREKHSAFQTAAEAMNAARELAGQGETAAAEAQQEVIADSKRQLARVLEAEWKFVTDGRQPADWIATFSELAASFVAAERALAGGPEAMKGDRADGEVAAAMTESPGGTSRELRATLERFQAQLAELEAEALTDENLLAAARVNSFENFSFVGRKWTTDRVVAKTLERDNWAPDFVAAYFDTEVEGPVKDYLTARVWEDCRMRSAAEERQATPAIGGVDPLDAYRDVLGEGRTVMIDAHAAQMLQEFAGRNEDGWRTELDRAQLAFDHLDDYDVGGTWRVERKGRHAMESACKALASAKEHEETGDHEAAGVEREFAAERQREFARHIEAEWELFRQERHLSDWVARWGELAAVSVAAQRALAHGREVVREEVSTASPDFSSALHSLPDRSRAQREQFRGALAELEAEALTDVELVACARANSLDDFALVARDWFADKVVAKSTADDYWEPEFVRAYFSNDLGSKTSTDVNEYLTARVWEHYARHAATALAEHDAATGRDAADPLAPYREALGAWRSAVIAGRAGEIARDSAGRAEVEWRADRDRARRALEGLNRAGARETLSLERDKQIAIDTACDAVALASDLMGRGDREAAEVKRWMAARSRTDIARLIDAEWQLFTDGGHLDRWMATNGELAALFVAAERALTSEQAVGLVGNVSHELRQPLQRFRVPLAQLEADALTDTALVDSARFKPMRKFVPVACEWVEDWMNNKERTANYWDAELLAAYRDTDVATVRDQVNGYLIARVWEHRDAGAPATTIERDGEARTEVLDPLGPYREIIGEVRSTVVDGRAQEIAQRSSERDPAWWRAERDRARVAFDGLDRAGAAEALRLEFDKQRAVEAVTGAAALVNELDESGAQQAAEVQREIAVRNHRELVRHIEAEWQLFEEGRHLDQWMIRHGESAATFVAAECALAKEQAVEVADQHSHAAEPASEIHGDIGVGMA